MVKTKKIIIKHIGPISVMNNIQGPILKPFDVDITTIMHLVVTGYKVFEILDNGKQISLNKSNYDKDFSKKKGNEQQQHVEEKKPETPAVEEDVEAQEEVKVQPEVNESSEGTHFENREHNKYQKNKNKK